MDYTKIMNDKSGKKARVGIVGATKGYGYTLLAQIPSVKLMELRAICSRHPEECLDTRKIRLLYVRTKQTSMLQLKIRLL